MKLFESKKKLKEDGEGASTPANTTGLGTPSLGNNPADPTDKTRGSGEKFDRLKEAYFMHSRKTAEDIERSLKIREDNIRVETERYEVIKVAHKLITKNMGDINTFVSALRYDEISFMKIVLDNDKYPYLYVYASGRSTPLPPESEQQKILKEFVKKTGTKFGVYYEGGWMIRLSKDPWASSKIYGTGMEFESTSKTPRKIV